MSSVVGWVLVVESLFECTLKLVLMAKAVGRTIDLAVYNDLTDWYMHIHNTLKLAWTLRCTIRENIEEKQEEP